MDHDGTVNAGDIARFAGVGPGAVSNWRRRYTDFPRPAGGTAASPVFSLKEVETWLRHAGKPFEITLGDRVWHRLRACGGDLDLGDLVGWAGTRLLGGSDPGPDNPELTGLLGRLAGDLGPEAAFDLIYRRYTRFHARELTITRPETAELMVRIVGAGDGTTLLDPACGTGTLLLAADGGRLLGQEHTPRDALLASVRLALRGADASVIVGDSITGDAFPEIEADGVVCDPPIGDAGWGHDELVHDPRWKYGLPPRGESELAWAQHCLAHVRPGGLVAILMPGVAAGRRSGRRIRANLLRGGALRAVLALPGGSDLWVLRHPHAKERQPTKLLIADASEDAGLAETAWRASAGGDTLPEGAVLVEMIDLLDEDVDLSPGRRVTPGGPDFSVVLQRAREVAAGLRDAMPAFEPADDADPPAMTTIGELMKAGLIRFEQGRMEVDRDRMDPDFVDGFLRSRGKAGRNRSGSTRIDARRTRIPRLPLDEQRRYGEAFRRLTALEEALRETADVGETLIRLGLSGLADGRLRPARKGR